MALGKREARLVLHTGAPHKCGAHRYLSPVDDIANDNVDPPRSLYSKLFVEVLQAFPQSAQGELLLNPRAFGHPEHSFRALSSHHAKREDGGPAAERPLRFVPAGLHGGEIHKMQDGVNGLLFGLRYVKIIGGSDSHLKFVAQGRNIRPPCQISELLT